MKVLIGTSSPPESGGGISTYCKQIAVALRSNGHEVIYVCPKGSADEWFHRNNVSHFSVFPREKQAPQCRDLVRLLDQQGVELIINNDNSLVQALAPIVRVPFLSVCHMDSSAISAMACVNHQWVDYVIAISYDMQDRLVKRYNVPRWKCPVIFNGILITDGMRTKVVAGDLRPLKAVFSGHYSRHKGGDIFLSFLLSSKVPDNVEFQWFGNVPARIARLLRGKRFVTHVGRVSQQQFLKELERSDVLLLPSRQEGCSMAVLEAMRAGTIPIVSNGRGAMRNQIMHGIDGFVCDLANWVDESAEVLMQLEQNRLLVESISESTKLSCAKLFDINDAIKRLLSLAGAPTIKRAVCHRTIDVYRWHRPRVELMQRQPTLSEKIFYKLGVLRREGVFRI